MNTSIKVNKIESAIYGLLRMDNVYFPLVNNSNIFKSDEECVDEPFMENCYRLFKELIEEIFDSNIKFTQTNKLDNCKYCSFKNTCKRYPKSY